MDSITGSGAYSVIGSKIVGLELPVFEDILRAGQLDLSNRVRRSNFSYKIIGTKIRIYPMPTTNFPKKLFFVDKD